MVVAVLLFASAARFEAGDEMTTLPDAPIVVTVNGRESLLTSASPKRAWWVRVVMMVIRWVMG